MKNSDSRQYEDKGTLSSSSSGLLYLLIGGGIGATLALLFAPKSGAELRTDISDLTKKGYEETVDLAHQLKDQSAEVYNSVKEKTGKVYDLAASKWSHLSESAMEVPGEIINGKTKLLDNDGVTKKAGARRSAEVH